MLRSLTPQELARWARRLLLSGRRLSTHAHRGDCGDPCEERIPGAAEPIPASPDPFRHALAVYREPVAEPPPPVSVSAWRVGAPAPALGPEVERA